MALSAEQQPNEGAPPAESNDSGATSLSEIGDTLAASMPEVQPAAVAASKEQQKNISGEKDDFGTLFDPAQHAVDADGKPKRTSKGAWTKKRNRSKTSAPVAGSRLGDGVPKVDAAVQIRTQALAAGKVASRTIIMLGITMFGEEWKPIVKEDIGLDEAAQLDMAFGEYFAAKGWTDIPPGWALTIALGGYAMPRFFMPKTRTRLQKAKDWVVSKWVAWRLKRRGIRAKVEPIRDDHREAA